MKLFGRSSRHPRKASREESSSPTCSAAVRYTRPGSWALALPTNLACSRVLHVVPRLSCRCTTMRQCPKTCIQHHVTTTSWRQVFTLLLRSRAFMIWRRMGSGISNSKHLCVHRRVHATVCIMDEGHTGSHAGKSCLPGGFPQLRVLIPCLRAVNALSVISAARAFKSGQHSGSAWQTSCWLSEAE